MTDTMTIKAIAPKSKIALDLALSYLRDGTLSIDDEGRIWRHYVHDRYGRRKCIERRRAESPTRKGYLGVVLGVRGTRRTAKVYAHILIWTWLRGPIPSGMQVNHKNLIKNCNPPDNLELTTGAGNIQHSYANGRKRPWTDRRAWPEGREWRPGKPLLTVEQKQQVIDLYRSGFGSHRISKATGISKTHVERIINAHGGAACLRK
jgi:hypothetical protein